MWIYDKHDNIINLDYIKAIHVDESKTFDSLGYSGLKKYVVCAADVTLNSRIIIRDFDNLEAAKSFIIDLKYDIDLNDRAHS